MAVRPLEWWVYFPSQPVGNSQTRFYPPGVLAEKGVLLDPIGLAIIVLKIRRRRLAADKSWYRVAGSRRQRRRGAVVGGIPVDRGPDGKCIVPVEGGLHRGQQQHPN